MRHRGEDRTGHLTLALSKVQWAMQKGEGGRERRRDHRKPESAGASLGLLFYNNATKLDTHDGRADYRVGAAEVQPEGR